MAIKTKLTIANGSILTLDELRPFEQKIQRALTNTFGQQADIDLQCNINVDSTISPSIEHDFSKVGKNLYIGETKGSTINASLRRAFTFECLAIKDEIANKAKKIVLIISTVGFIKTANVENPINKEEEAETTEDTENSISFDAIVPKYRLDKVILDVRTKGQLARAIALIRNQELIFDTWGFREVDPNTKTILCFFGAPGTGKTMCAHAIAKELGKKIMVASYASIESKWVGEGPKNMRKIFKDAADQDALLFFDEADSFLSKRVNNAETSSDKHYNRMSNEMFQLLEEYDGVVVFATNLVSDFDKAFKSRILSFVEFALPDSDTRAKLIETMIPSKLPLEEPLSANIIQPLANCSDGFSGREIRKALLTSLSEAALKGKNRLGLNDLLVGFDSVKQEREAIEETASKQRGVIADFLETNEQNRAIIDICQWALNQKDGYTDSSKAVLYKICRILNLDMPDLTISYKNKDIHSSANLIANADRIDETLMYVTHLIVSSDMTQGEAKSIINTLSNALGYDMPYALEYYNSYKNLTSR